MRFIYSASPCRYDITTPAITLKVNRIGLSAHSNGTTALRKANINIAIKAYSSRFSILLLSPFEYKHIIHTLNMIVNRKITFIIKKWSVTSGGGTRNHRPSPQILAKTQISANFS